MSREKIYLAAPFGTTNSEKRLNAESASRILYGKGFDVFCPWKYAIPHAWDYPNEEWGLMVFTNDVHAIDNCDYVVVLSYGREDTTVGTSWEAGYAFGIGKKVIIVEMNDNVQSLMMANGRWATIKGLKELNDYDFKSLPKSRTNTEQK